jgi:hypothetical protein
MRKRALPGLLATALRIFGAINIFLSAPIASSQQAGSLRIDSQPGAVVISNANGAEILRYITRQPPDSRIAVQSACYFHPFTTPSGISLTQVAPMDHLHHRGIFLGWISMLGKTNADFWGSGTYAPVKGRVIVNREITSMSAAGTLAHFTALNYWLADGEPLMVENLSAAIRPCDSAYVLDIAFTLIPAADITLERRAFSGFCVRLPRIGELEAFGSQGLVTLPNPKPADPDSNWPAANWYGYRIQFEDGTSAGIVVVDHHDNPPALWHNRRDLRMLNPCIVARGNIELRADQPLRLRYRVIAHDGPAPPAPALSFDDLSFAAAAP